MGSMRNPVGPLPSSIYWRRRAVALCLLALVAVLVVVVLNSGGRGGGKGSSAPTGSHTPIATITAGPAPSGTHISGRPGGRDTSSGGSANGGSSGGSSGSSDSGAAGGPAPSGGTSSGGAGATGAASGGGSGTGGSDASTTGGPVPVGSSLPDCAPGAVQLTLTSAQNSYAPGDTPAFRLKAANSSAVTCKMDFGPRSAVFTVTNTKDNSHVWASDDCPAGGSYLMEVPAHGSTTYTLQWNGRTSSPQCAQPKGQQAQPGTYLVQAKAPGHDAKQVSFVMSSY